MAATALGAGNTAFGFGCFFRAHCRRLRCSSAKLTLSRFIWPELPPVSVQDRALNRTGHGASHKTIKPVVVCTLGANLPFVDGSAAPFGFDAVFGRQMLRQQAMSIRIVCRIARGNHDLPWEQPVENARMISNSWCRRRHGERLVCL